MAYVGPSGGRLREIINIIKDEWLFLRGHIEAMLIIDSHTCECTAFSNTGKVIFLRHLHSEINDFEIEPAGMG